MKRAQRGPWARLILVLAAVLSLVIGYYLGQHWRHRPLADLSAELYAEARQVTYPSELAIGAGDEGPGVWRLFLVADTGQAACRKLVRHFASVINRLAAWPDIQGNLRLTVLAYDQPDAAAVTAITGGAPWAEVVSAGRPHLDALSGQLGLVPGADWCTAAQADTVLVSPQRTRRARIRPEQAAIMAHKLRTIIAFVE